MAAKLNTIADELPEGMVGSMQAEIECVTTSGNVSVTSTASVGPQLSVIPNKTIQWNKVSAPIPFTVTDEDTAIENVSTTAHAVDKVLLPDTGIIVSGTSTGRSLTIRPANNRSGSTSVSVIAHDGQHIAVSKFTVTVSRRG